MKGENQQLNSWRHMHRTGIRLKFPSCYIFDPLFMGSEVREGRFYHLRALFHGFLVYFYHAKLQKLQTPMNRGSFGQ